MHSSGTLFSASPPLIRPRLIDGRSNSSEDSRENPFVMALCDVAARLTSGESLSVGRDGASDAGSFLEAGVPAVEFGPSGAGHHGPDEWVSVGSLSRYRRAIGDFILSLPEALERPPEETPGSLRAVDGGLA